MFEWTKRKVAAALAVLAAGVTGGVFATRDGSDQPAPRRAEGTTQRAAEPAPTTTRAQESAEAEEPEPEGDRESREPPSRRRTASTPDASGRRIRTLRPGDTLWEIAGAQLGRDATNARIARRVRYLARLNELDDPDLILAGEELRLRA
jgi:Tfp pilus assembly protein FimV